VIEIDGSDNEGKIEDNNARVTEQLRTNLWVINYFLPIETQIREEKKKTIIALKSPSQGGTSHGCQQFTLRRQKS
jgi:hypothetical protein